MHATLTALVQPHIHTKKKENRLLRTGNVHALALRTKRLSPQQSEKDGHLSAGLVLALVPVLDLSRLNVLKEDLVVGKAGRAGTRDGCEEVNEEVIEFPEGNSRTHGARRVHGAAREGALSKNTRNHCQANAQGGSVLFGARG